MSSGSISGLSSTGRGEDSMSTHCLKILSHGVELLHEFTILNFFCAQLHHRSFILARELHVCKRFGHGFLLQFADD